MPNEKCRIVLISITNFSIYVGFCDVDQSLNWNLVAMQNWNYIYVSDIYRGFPVCGKLVLIQFCSFMFSSLLLSCNWNQTIRWPETRMTMKDLSRICSMLSATIMRCQFQQHFTSRFFMRKYYVQFSVQVSLIYVYVPRIFQKY